MPFLIPKHSEEALSWNGSVGKNQGPLSTDLGNYIGLEILGVPALKILFVALSINSIFRLDLE